METSAKARPTLTPFELDRGDTFVFRIKDAGGEYMLGSWLLFRQMYLDRQMTAVQS